jgi:cobalt/nickel transport protein
MIKKALIICFSFLIFSARLYGHFQMLIPANDIVEDPKNSTITLDLIFCHPFEGDVMNMAKPAKFGVIIKGDKKENLIGGLSEYKIEEFSAWRTTYKLNQPGDYVFYVAPQPYWEPAEEKFIVHYTKVIVDAFGLEIGWDREIGLKTEIIPLTRPYGLYAGNMFQGLVLVDGKPASFTEVEVEYYNKEGKYQAPAGPFITQVIKTDDRGVFSYAMPVSGWWGFAALNEADDKMLNPDDGKHYPVEIGALIWIHAADLK